MNVLEPTYTRSKKKTASFPAIETRQEDFSKMAVPGYAERWEESPRSEAGLRVSEEEYWAKYYHHPDFQYEWNNGILEEKPMADYLSSKMYRWFLALLNEYVKARPLAKIICLDIGFRLALPEKTSIRKPDLAVILDANPVAIADDDSTYKGIFDLCIEFLSDSKPGEVTRDTVVKKMEYCQAGVKEYFILDRKGRETAFYRLTERGLYVPMRPQTGEIIRSEQLPGFQFRCADLYARPPLMERLADEVYRDYILLEYQAERHRADAERHRADAEHQRADTERQRADTERQRAEAERQRAEAAEKKAAAFAAQLRALGISVE